MSKIVISYRRTDTAAIAGRIRDRLVSRYGDTSVFMDIENIPFGSDFRTHIREALLQSDVLIAVVGPDWLGRGNGGPSRISNETDPVRIEIETALQGRIPLIPVLVNNAGMPEAADLPDSLKDFAFLNAADVDTGRDFHQHMERLIQALDGFIERKSGKAATLGPTPASTATPRATIDGPAAARASRNWIPVVSAAAVTVVVAGLGAAWFLKTPPKPAVTQAAQQPVGLPTNEAANLAPAAKAVVPAANSSIPATAGRNVAGCHEPSPAFLDEFKTNTAGWIHLGETRIGSNAYYDDDEMVVMAAAQNTKWIVVPSRKFKNVTICADIKSPEEATALGATAGGLVFWTSAGNIDNIYTANLYPDGSYAILRKYSGTWSTIVSKRSFASIRKGLEAQNQIKITLKDRIATLTINGVKAQDFQGEPPEDGGLVGLFARSEKDQTNEWRFLKIVVAQEP